MTTPPCCTEKVMVYYYIIIIKKRIHLDPIFLIFIIFGHSLLSFKKLHLICYISAHHIVSKLASQFCYIVSEPCESPVICLTYVRDISSTVGYDRASSQWHKFGGCGSWKLPTRVIRKAQHTVTHDTSRTKGTTYTVRLDKSHT